MSKEYHVEFLERVKRTPAANSYRFKRPAGLNFSAGQYMLVDLGNELVHALSLSDCPEEPEFIEFTKRMTDSRFCQRLESLARGEVLSVRGPQGQFTLGETRSNIIMIAGGIGITPIRSILKSCEKQQRVDSGIVLIYGNNDKNDIAFKEELEKLQLPGYRLAHVLADNTGMEDARHGFITAEIIATESKNMEDASYMISGPPGMVKAMQNALAGIKVPADRIHTDVFIGYA